MKKIIAALCAMLLLLSVASCGKKEEETGTGKGNETSTKKQYVESDTSEPESDTDSSESATESASETETETKKPQETESEKEYTDADFKKVDEIIYITSDLLSVRVKPQSGAKIDRYLKFGASAKRVGYNEVWSILEIGGVKYYAYSAHMTTTNFTGSDFTDMEKTTMYVTVDTLNVRLYPSTEKFSTSKGLLSKNDAVTCVGTNGKWYHIEYKDGFGYVSASCLSKTKPSENPDFDLSGFKFYEEPISLFVTADKLNVRHYPSADNAVSAIEGSLTKDEKITCYGDNGEWVQIDYNGNKFYVNGKYLARIVGGDPIFGEKEPDLTGFNFYKEPKTLYVTADTLNVRKYPSADDKVSVIKGKFVKDQAVLCYGDNGTWAQVNWNGYKYYVNVKYLSDTLGGSTGEEKPDLSDFTLYETPVTMYVTASFLRIRRLPDIDAATLKDETGKEVVFTKGDAVVCTGCNDNWYQILIDGKYYYVGKTFIEADKPATPSAG